MTHCNLAQFHHFELIALGLIFFVLSDRRLGSGLVVVGWTMKWATLLKDFKEKVGLAQSPDASTSADSFPVDLSAPPSSSSSSTSPSASHPGASSRLDFSSSPSRYHHLLFWLCFDLIVVATCFCLMGPYFIDCFSFRLD